MRGVRGGSGWRGKVRLYRQAPTGLKGGIAAGDAGCARVAAGKRQTDQNVDFLSAQKVGFWGVKVGRGQGGLRMVS